MNRIRHACVIAGVSVALIGAGVVTPMAAPSDSPQIWLTAAGAQDIVIDFVEHGVVTDDVPPDQPNPTIGVSGLPPGTPLNDQGLQEAQNVGQLLFDQLGGPHGVAGIFAGIDTRMAQTVAPFAQLEQMPTQILPGLDEVDGGQYAGYSQSSPAGILFDLALLAWAFGLRDVRMPGSVDFNGTVFQQIANGAVTTMYADAMANPVVSDTGNITTVAGSGEAAISGWVLMNVKNPDLAFFLPRFYQSLVTGDAGGSFLHNGGVVEVQGNPIDGWTLVSWAGQDVPADPGLLTELLVDVRNVIAAPQTAGYEVLQAALSGDTTAIGDAVQTGLGSIATVLAQFPGAVAGDIASELQHLAADLAAGESFSDAFGSAILGLV